MVNRLGKLAFGVALLAIASACNQAPDNVQVSEEANVQPASNEAQMSNDVAQDNRALATPEGPAASSSTAAQPASNTASDSRPAARADDARRPPPKAPPQPEPDPHAGHDMGNMANMSH